MKCSLRTQHIGLLAGFILLIGPSAPGAVGQSVFTRHVISLPLHQAPASKSEANVTAVVPSSSFTSFPSWDYSIVAYDGKTYSGTLLGRSPYNHGKTTTTIPLQIIPLVITISDSLGTRIYDPTVAYTPDSCNPGVSAVNLVSGSPLLTNSTDWSMNGQNIGPAQYIDAHTRAEFWSLVSNTPYHLIFKPQVLPAQSLNISGFNNPGCDDLFGMVQLSDIDAAIDSLMTGPLAGQINPGTLPVFITTNVLFDSLGASIAGYHAGRVIGNNIQYYDVSDIETRQVVSLGYVSFLAHELAETVNDFKGTNATPPWGHVGQEPSCQTNLEVGDPLTFNDNVWTVQANGLKYEMQELAFFSWFYGAPSLGAGGLYSNNGTFTTPAAPCS